MFEAIRTGHSAYATFHGDRAEEVYKRLINPPMSLPPSVLSALHLIMVQFRHRRMGVRRTLEVVEIVPGDREVELNIIYRWNPRNDTFDMINKSSRIHREIELHTGMSEKEIEHDIRRKITILEWLMKHGIKTVNTIGKIMAEYYRDEEVIVKMAEKNENPRKLFDEDLLQELEGAKL
jgi:flagellar protein FlaI